jgi:hypothetical protein
MSYFYNWAYFLGIKHCLVVLGGVTVENLLKEK